ncbi:MAG: putative iron-sulfur cluster-binding metallochaperone [Pseudomonadales bacterium]
MSTCCSTSNEEVHNNKRQVAICPRCGNGMKPVERLTIVHHVVAPLNQSIPCDPLFFCSCISCSVVYFSNEDFVIETAKVRGEVGQKSVHENRMICYCFDITNKRVMAELAQAGHSSSKAFVVEQTRLKNCACNIRNPSGKCCLKEFPK